MNKARKYIKKHNDYIVEKINQQSWCKHKWEEHGFGYQCTICNYYTGLNNDLNSLIKLK